MAEQVIGAKVRIEVNQEGSYEGYVHHIDPASKKLSLVKVVACATGTRLHGLHHFFPKEIADLTVLEQRKKEEHDNILNAVPINTDRTKDAEITDPDINEKPLKNKQQSKGMDLPFKDKRKFSHKDLRKGKSRRDPSDEGPRMLQTKSVGQNCNSEDFVETSEDYENFTINPPDVMTIDLLDESFEQAIAYISRQRVVGVAWEGIKVGRFGQLCLIQMGCNKCIYVFDIVKLGGQAFDSGLADILDSANILKVIHNCRHFSDALYHQYGVCLVNVFDTQVADAIIYRNEVPDRKLPRQTSSLIACLYEYLDLSPDQYHFHKVRLKHTKDDEMAWAMRPIKSDLIDVASKTVMYLRELRLSQMQRMMEEFIHGVDIYLSCVRDATDEDVQKKFSSIALPEMFFNLQSRERPRYRQLDHDLISSDSEEQRQAWKEGHDFMVKYEQRGMRIREHKYAPFTANPERSSSLLGNDERQLHKDESKDKKIEVDNLRICEKTSEGQSKQRHFAQDTNRFSTDRGRFWPGNSGIFSYENFPQLSSDSDSGGQSPRASSGMQQIRSLRDPRFGRGRAASLIRNAHLPGARKPNENPYGTPTYGSSSQKDLSSYACANQHGKSFYNISMGQHDRLQFPPDEELLTSSEIVTVSGQNAVPNGSRVRISRQ